MPDVDDKNDNEFGHIECKICGAHDTVDINDTAAMLDWMIKHMFGHVEQEDEET